MWVRHSFSKNTLLLVMILCACRLFYANTRVFFLKSTPQHMWVMWVMWVYIMWVEIGCIRYDKIAKQNVSWVSCGKALPARHLWKLAVTICHDSLHSSHVLSTCFTLQEGFSRATRENFFGLQLPWVFTSSLTHNPYKEIPYKI